MPTKAQCWVVSYARVRDGASRSASAEGLLTIPQRHNLMLLHTHPDGARLAHAAHVVGLSPGRKVRVGDYECELLMLAPHGGGGNPAYAAAFVMPGEILPTMNAMNKDESWLTWLGLDDEFDQHERVQLRAPQLPHPDDPQPSGPVAFGFSGAVAYAPEQTQRVTSYRTPQMAQEAYERERMREPSTHTQHQPSQRAPPAHLQQPRLPQYQQRVAPPSTVEKREQPTPANEEQPTVIPRQTRVSVFEEEFLDDHESFEREVRFEEAPANDTNDAHVAPKPATSYGTSDEMETLRRQLAELERLTGVSADDAERVLNANMKDVRTIVPDEVVETAIEAPTTVGAAAAQVVKPRHEATVEVPPTVPVSSNVFKEKDAGFKKQAISTDEAAAHVKACAPVVRASPQKSNPPATTSVPNVAVTPEEIDANDAWAAAIARRNRSVDEESDSNDSDVDVGESTKREPAAKIVHQISKQPNRVSYSQAPKPREMGAPPQKTRAVDASSPIVAAMAATFEDAQKKEAVFVEEPYVTGSVSARASIFGEQASFRKA